MFELGDYELHETLGEGSFGKVKYALNRVTKEPAAIKIINKGKVGKKSIGMVHRELFLLRMLDHPNVIKLRCTINTEHFFCIVLEYAEGGELFDRIEPDYGMNHELAHMYFCQLILGLEHCHSKGVSHRDLKPENLLLDGNANLKISDFGLSTLFAANGKSRLLQTMCGSPCYVAPEVLSGRTYCGIRADIWSVGVILYALHSGRLPWDEPIRECPEFGRIVLQQDFSDDVWQRFPLDVQDLLSHIFVLDPNERYTLSQIKQHTFFRRFNVAALQVGKRRREIVRGIECTGRRRDDPRPRNMSLVDVTTDLVSSSTKRMLHKHVSFSFPELSRGVSEETQDDSQESWDKACTQPVHPVHLEPFKDIMNRLTRIKINQDPRMVFEQLKCVFDDLKAHHEAKDSACKARIMLPPTHKGRTVLCKVRIKTLQDPGWHIIDFQRIRGDMLEFKRFFANVRRKMADVIAP